MWVSDRSTQRHAVLKWGRRVHINQIVYVADCLRQRASETLYPIRQPVILKVFESPEMVMARSAGQRYFRIAHPLSKIDALYLLPLNRHDANL